MKILEELKSHIENKIFPFAVYCKPKSNTLVALFQYPGVVYHGFDSNSKGFVFAPFDDKEKTFFISEENAQVIIEDFVPAVNLEARSQTTVIDSISKGAFEALVAKSVNTINDGTFEKLVCSRVEKVEFESDIIDAFEKMVYAYPNAFRYCFYDPIVGFWMGATPEQLLKANGDTIQTVALAGTQLYKEGEEAVWQTKERQEQQFVTEYILNELKPFATNVETTHPCTFRAGNIVHIKTDIQAKLKDGASLKDVINTLHPTPAVCGLPKAEAKKFLLENEGYNREYYSGFLGEVNYDFAAGEEGKTDLFVNLRCMKVEDNIAHLYIGCGITKDSDPEKEFIETVNKSMTMRRVLAP